MTSPSKPDTNSRLHSEIGKVSSAYLALLNVPHDSEWRALNQDIYARLRDRISELSGVEPEWIQNTFEERAFAAWNTL